MKELLENELLKSLKHWETKILNGETEGKYSLVLTKDDSSKREITKLVKEAGIGRVSVATVGTTLPEDIFAVITVMPQAYFKADYDAEVYKSVVKTGHVQYID